nr:hypothetical protein [Natronobacterium gregoryi]
MAVSSFLWMLAIGLYGVGDLVTTAVGIRNGLEEGQPFVRWLLGDSPTVWRFALFGLFKTGLLGGFYLGSLALEGVWFRIAVPAGIAAIGGYAVYSNLRVLSTMETR